MGDGAILSYRSFGWISARPELLPEPLKQDEVLRFATLAFEQSGLGYALKLSHEDVEDVYDQATFKIIPAAKHTLWFDLYDGPYRLLDCNASIKIDAALGEIEGMSVATPHRNRLFQKRPSILPFRDIDIPVARSVVAAGAFARMRAGGAYGAWLEEDGPTERGLWLAERKSSREWTSDVSDAHLAAAERGEGTPVWVVRLAGQARPFKGGTASFPLVRGYVDAATGRLLFLDYMDGLGMGGAVPTPKRRNDPALSGPVSVTYAGKARGMRLVPVSAARPFVPSGGAILSLGKAVLSAEYDAKGRLVRFRGRLARALEGGGGKG